MTTKNKIAVWVTLDTHAQLKMEAGEAGCHLGDVVKSRVLGADGAAAMNVTHEEATIAVNILNELLAGRTVSSVLRSRLEFSSLLRKMLEASQRSKPLPPVKEPHPWIKLA